MVEMHLTKIFYHDFIKKNNVMMFYNGAVTHNITSAFTKQIELEFNNLPLSTRVKKRVFILMVECMQNISKHSVFINGINNVGYGSFLVLDKEDSYELISANLVNNEQANKITKIIDNVNSKDEKGLKEFFKNQLIEGVLSEKGGAGLGFIGIARKASEKLEYDFIEYDDKCKIFLLKVKVLKH